MEGKEEFDKAVAFIAGRDLQAIPIEEVRDFTKGQDVANVRLAVFYELWRCRNDYSYFRQVETRSIRDLWYSLIKPFLSRVEDPERVNQAKWGRYRSQTQSAVMSEMVLAGLCKYSDFKIEDRSRPKSRPYEWDKLKVGRFDEVVLFIEKDASFPKIEKLANLLGFAVECGKGQQATAAIEGLIEYLTDGKSYLVFCLTDFDYYGHLIMTSLTERAGALGLDAQFMRVGVEIEQVPEARRDVARFLLPLSSKPEEEWAAQYAIEGKYGLEIESLTPQELRGIIADAVYENCDTEALYTFLKEKALEGVPGEVSEAISEDDDEVIDFRGKIAELEKKLAELKDALLEKLKPRAEELLEDKIGEIDDRPAFPWEWLRLQIVEGGGYLAPGKYTDPSGISEALKEMMADE